MAMSLWALIEMLIDTMQRKGTVEKGKSTYELVTFCLVSDAKIVPWNNFRERLWTMCLRNKSSQFYFESAEGFSGTLPYY
jgi:hypothetical protein